MLTTSKRWAIVTGFAIVGAAIIGGALVSRSYKGPDVVVAALVSTPTSAPKLSPSTSPQSTPSPVAGANATSPVAPASIKAGEVVAAGDVPHFDVVRVEPSGESVLAGQGAPNSSVDLVASGKVVAQAPTDGSGHFVILPPTLKPGDYALSLRQPGVDGASAESTQSVAVSVPEKGKGQVVVAMAEPGRATKLLSAPPIAMPGLTPASKNGPEGAVQRALANASPDAQPFKPQGAFEKDAGLAVRSVELENGNGFFASGAAAPGTELHIYLNNSHLADVAAGIDGSWSVKIKKGLTGGHYIVRVDAAADATKVAARVEVPFDVPVAMAETSVPSGTPPALGAAVASKPAETAAIPPSSHGSPATALPVTAGTSPLSHPTANAVIDEVSTAIVRSGDNLWDISRVRLGQGRRYTRIYAANATQIRNPSLIYPGQVFVLPSQND